MDSALRSVSGRANRSGARTPPKEVDVLRLGAELSIALGGPARVRLSASGSRELG